MSENEKPKKPLATNVIANMPGRDTYSILPILRLRPYRCEDCDERFLRGYSKCTDATTEPSHPRRKPESSRTEPESHRSASRW